MYKYIQEEFHAGMTCKINSSSANCFHCKNHTILGLYLPPLATLTRGVCFPQGTFPQKAAHPKFVTLKLYILTIIT